MTYSRHPGSYFQLLWGLLIVAAGIVLLLDNFYIVDAREIFRYWPVLLIGFGLYRLTSSKRHIVGGLIWTTLGLLLLIDKLRIAYIHVWDFWPLIFVFIGVNMLLGYSRRQRRYERWQADNGPAGNTAGPGGMQPPPAPSSFVPPQPGTTGADAFNDSYVNASAVLSGSNRISTSQNFRGGHVTAVMGGSEIDLRRASIDPANGPAVLDVFTFWGGIKIQVPVDWTVDVQGTPILGGIDNKTLPPAADTGKRLVITGEAMMGGVEITN